MDENQESSPAPESMPMEMPMGVPETLICKSRVRNWRSIKITTILLAIFSLGLLQPVQDLYNSLEVIIKIFFWIMASFPIILLTITLWSCFEDQEFGLYLDHYAILVIKGENMVIVPWKTVKEVHFQGSIAIPRIILRLRTGAKEILHPSLWGRGGAQADKMKEFLERTQYTKFSAS